MTVVDSHCLGGRATGGRQHPLFVRAIIKPNRQLMCRPKNLNEALVMFVPKRQLFNFFFLSYHEYFFSGS